MLSDDVLEQARAFLVVRLRGPLDRPERQKLAHYFLLVDRERGRRRAQRPVNARSRPQKAEEGESLAHRVVAARNSLYGDAQKEEIRRRAQQAKRDMATWRNR